jgi:fumagillin biosynthesis dioxygenase
MTPWEQLEREGWCVFEDVLTPEQCAEARRRLDLAAEESERRGAPTRIAIDPNERNIRVFNLLDLDPLFRDLIRHPAALRPVRALLGEDFLISNFTANIALPGSQSMRLHSDLSIVMPEPWHHPFSINVIWCLDDVYPQNGATLYIPGSHKCLRRADLGADPESRLVPFQAPEGAIIVMDGRLWHTSGANVTADRQRALLFGYYSAPFIRPQVNHNATLSAEVQASLDPQMRHWLGLEPEANISLSGHLHFAED